MARKKNKRVKRIFALLVILTLLASAAYIVIDHQSLKRGYYSARHFDIETIKSDTDYDGDGVDDYTDIMLSARAYMLTKPTYTPDYFAGGYPPKGKGVCTDLVVEVFRGAGYYLKDLVDEDISNNRAAYTTIETPDPNIDYRRVKNLKIFFDRNATVLTTDTNKIAELQPGDIVIFSKMHIAIISDKRNKDGKPFIIHHGSDPAMEEDHLMAAEIAGHYRWKK